MTLRPRREDRSSWVRRHPAPKQSDPEPLASDATNDSFAKLFSLLGIEDAPERVWMGTGVGQGLAIYGRNLIKVLGKLNERITALETKKARKS